MKTRTGLVGREIVYLHRRFQKKKQNFPKKGDDGGESETIAKILWVIQSMKRKMRGKFERWYPMQPR